MSPIETKTTAPNTYNPNRRAKLAGSVGRLIIGMRAGKATGSQETRPFTLTHEDGMRGGVAVESQEGQQLAGRLRATPRLRQPQWVDSAQFAGAMPVTRFEFSEGDTVELPVTNFVAAPGLASWEGRGSVKTTSDGRQVSSASVIRQYARRGTPMPDIQGVMAYVQPNGMVLFAGVQDGAHRLAAAHLRGDETIGVSAGLSVYALDHDIIATPPQDQQ